MMGALRKIKRNMAKEEMKKCGLKRICSWNGARRVRRTKVSCFSSHWREYV